MLAPWKESSDKPRQCIKKQRLTLLTKVYIVKAMVFPVVMYRCENFDYIDLGQESDVSAFGYTV